MSGRVAAEGKHLSAGGEPFRAHGVTYGSFAARLDGARFPERAMIKADLAAIAAAGLNTLRTYSLPPVELLEIAEDHGLRVLVGVDYSDWRMEADASRGARRRILDAGRRAVGAAMEICAGRDSVLAVAVGNEVPVDLVRLHGIGHVEETLSRLIDDVHAADPGMPATYVNFPTTEFLDVANQDVYCFNVFLEDPSAFERYLRHLQVVAGGHPLLLTELGLAAAVHGEQAQADALRWQLDIVDRTGLAGATVFAWTDDWAVADVPVEGWGFGITTEQRIPKIGFDAVQDWAGRDLIDLRREWPQISVIVCAYNEESTIEECLGSLAASGYPELDVVMCDDGSTDRTLELARRFPFRILDLPHAGLSRARNAGLEAATGEIVAYLDADAACHPDWPYYLALSMEDDVAATGGPNLPFPAAGFTERVVAASPGQPLEVLVADDRAEHVPGCNMAYRRESLLGLGGFNVAFTAAGDDVDVCWRLQDEGDEIGFSPAAQIWHHRRGSVMGYLKQQRGYGRAEKMLSGPHPHRFNRLGQARWAGFIYGASRLLPGRLRPVVYHGYQGQAPFQPVARRRSEVAAGWAAALLPLTLPVALAGVLLSFLSSWWLLVPAVMAALVLAYGVAVAVAVRVDRTEPYPVRMRALVGILHVAQPFVRTWGRIRGSAVAPAPQQEREWWGDRARWLDDLRRQLAARRCTVAVGGLSASWDLEARLGPFWTARITTAVAWEWEPRWRVSRRIRWESAAVALLIAGGIAVVDWQFGGLAVSLLLLTAVVDWHILGRRVAASVRSSVGRSLP